MYFYQTSFGYSRNKEGIHLVPDNWNDYGFIVLYAMYYVDSNLKEEEIGHIRIGSVGLEGGRVEIPSSFIELDKKYFSLGMGVNYYNNIKNLGDDIRKDILSSLNDMAYSEDAYNIGIEEDVTKNALLRDQSSRVIENQYRRVARGGAVLTEYDFSYTIDNSKSEYKKLEFLVEPNSLPPTNIHAIIGSNGTGKTTTLKSILNKYINDDLDIEFSNAILVSFSIFDSYHELLNDIDNSKIRFSYIGSNKEDGTNKSHEEIKNEFNKSILNLIRYKKVGTFLKVLTNLDGDDNLSEYGIKEIIYDIKCNDNYSKSIKSLCDIFAICSSGHQIILLTLARLVELMVEKSLVIIDEPETHLHPPLLSSFIRSLSELAIDTNAVVLIATHSPIVLQEIPKSCVSILRTNGDYRNVSRPRLETFGENIGILTEEIFGLEIRNTGFYKLLKEKTNYYKGLGYDYDKILDKFNGELSIEAKSIIRMYLK